MECYNQLRLCPKCGAGGASTLYVAEQNTLARQCPRCGFGWEEKPLDGTEPVAPCASG